MKIKDLVWEPHHQEGIIAYGLRGYYHIYEWDGYWAVDISANEVAHGATKEAAKAAANEHHKQQIMKWVE